MPRKTKATRAAEAMAPEAAPAPTRRGRLPRAKVTPQPPAAENGSAPGLDAAEASAAAEPNDAPASEPVDAGEATAEATPAEPTPAPEDAAAPSKPAAQWNQAADTVQFDWPEIEQTASRPGPNQVMAKLLVAARAEGANSRWPLQAP